MHKVLAVDRDLKVHETQKQAGAKIGMEHIRVDTMHDAIIKAEKEEFLFIAINADNIDFMPLLPILRGITATFILVVTATPTSKEQTAALDKGADLYTGWLNFTADDNAVGALAMINRHNERLKSPRPSLRIMAYKDLLVAPLQRCVAVGNQTIDLTRREFDILRFLMEHRGRVFTYKQIFRKVWGEEYEDAAKTTLWTAIRRLRSKLREGNTKTEYIECINGVGYRFPS